MLKYGHILADGWQWKKLSKIAQINPPPQKAEDESEVTFLGMADVSEAGKIINAQIRKFREVSLGFTSFKGNDVLIAKITPCFENGKGCLAEGLKNNVGFGSTEFHVLRPTPEVLPRYLHLLTVTHHFRGIGEIYMTGSAGQKRVPADFLRDYIIPLPPIAEQERIIDIILSWSHAIEKTEKLIEAKRSWHVALANKLLSRKSSAVPLKKILKLTLRDVAKPDKPYWALGIRSHGKGTFRRFIENPASVAMDTLYRVRHDDLIVNITFAWEGAIAFVDKADEDCLVSHRFPTFEIDINKALPAYLRHVIVQKRFVRNLALISPGGAGRNRVLNKTDFLNLKIALPEIKEQEKIGDVLNTSLREISLLEAKLELLKKQKRGLMQKLLTGEWRVKVE
ncbi:MAG: restriction endonuclease subunit S [Nitrospirota bacterium]